MSDTEILNVRLTVPQSAIQKIVGNAVADIRLALETTITEKLAGLITQQAEAASKSFARGVELGPDEKLKAADLRAALLLGKVPEDTGILVDTKTAARLLNVSARTWYRLCDIKAAPAPLRLGNLVRWRLAEILAWVEANCPPQKHWSYSAKSTK